MYETVLEIAKSRPAIAGIVLLGVVQLMMVWRRRGADEKSRAHYNGDTTIFKVVLHTTKWAQFGMIGLAAIQEIGIQVARVLRAMGKA